MNKTKIFFVHASRSPFILNDLELLNKHFCVKSIDLTSYRGSNQKKLKNAPKILLDMFKGILWADITFSWFADIHTFLAVLLSKIFRRKSIVVVGGYEVVKAPEIRYGGMIDQKKHIGLFFILKNADKILAVSKKNKSEILKWVNRDISLIYNGIDCDRFRLSEGKLNVIITVGTINHIPSLKRKGTETFIKSARYLPQTLFQVIGKCTDDSIKRYLKSIAPPNVRFEGFVNEQELVKIYQRAKVICQLSFYESFGVALAEAMACGCIPVVTNKGALPEVVGDTGLYVPYGDEKATAEAIKKALDYTNELCQRARERIMGYFSMKSREVKIIDIIKSVLQ